MRTDNISGVLAVLMPAFLCVRCGFNSESASLASLLFFVVVRSRYRRRRSAPLHMTPAELRPKANGPRKRLLLRFSASWPCTSCTKKKREKAPVFAPSCVTPVGLDKRDRKNTLESVVPRIRCKAKHTSRLDRRTVTKIDGKDAHTFERPRPLYSQL